ncbi:hypothetical protein GDO81_020546 [Engystomops pustulosus]|uniref:G-protein coupled receptors family 1 profile domain-containing protein n=1 Tax=Engystomops pustulosus TaxID=76066 RepID=A0AAV6YV41_ENGPU|nr:hypothetical protein GDO81_020546 [Engystomops pustulosus]
MDVIHIVRITVFSIIFLLGIIGNGLVIWIAGFRMKKTISSVWFLHLSIADFLCCACIPLWIADSASSGGVCLSLPISCLLNYILLYLTFGTSISLLTAMSVDRWVSVMWPFWAKVHRTQKRVRIHVGIIWFQSLIWTGLMLGIFGYHYFYKKFSYNSFLSINLIMLVMQFVIPFLIIVTSYVTIFLKLRKSKRLQRSRRPYRIIAAVILCFFLCWAPHHIFVILFRLHSHNYHLYIAHSITDFLAYLNSCLNPIIYVFMGQDFRQGFLRSIPFRVEKALSDPPDDPCREQEEGEPVEPNTHV